MCKDMPLQVVGFYKGNAECGGKAFGKRGSYEQRPHKARPERDAHGRELLFRHACLPQGFAHHGHDVLLMRPRGEFRHYAAVGFVHGLAGRNVAQQHAVFHHGGRGVVATGLDAQYYYVVLIILIHREREFVK